MNIIHLINNKVWGGGERYVLDLALSQRAEGHNVMVFTCKAKPVTEIFEREGLLGGTMWLNGSIDFFSPVRLSHHLNRLSGKTIIHVHNFKSAYTALAARKLAAHPEEIKVVCTRHLIHPAKTDKSHTELLQGLDALIFVSRKVGEVFYSSNPQIDKEKCHTILNSIRDEASFPAQERASGPTRLFFASRLTPEKGLDTLIKAMELLKDCDVRLTICGTGRSRYVMPLVRLSRGLETEPKIDWLGHVENIYKELEQCDIAVYPATAPEPFGLTILEAMSCGKAVVASNNGAQPEIITDGKDGVLIPPSDPETLANVLRDLIGDADKRAELGRAARETFEQKFRYSEFYQETMEVYCEC